MVGLAAIGTIALLAIPSGPASAGGPLLFAPWALGHLIRAVTLPFAIAASAVSATASYAYGEPPYSAPPPNYYGPSYGQGYYAPGYAAPPAYYPAPSYYAPSYYASRPAYSGYGRPYGYPYPYGHGRYYGPRGYDAAPRLRYSGPHGSQGWHGGGGYYRRR